MKESGDGFVRADQIDLKSLDEQLERHLNRALTMEKTKKRKSDDNIVYTAASAASTAKPPFADFKPRQEWEIDPSKLIIKSVIARGTFGTVHRGVYDSQDVAGQSDSFLNCFSPFSFSLTVFSFPILRFWVIYCRFVFLRLWFYCWLCLRNWRSYIWLLGIEFCISDKNGFYRLIVQCDSADAALTFFFCSWLYCLFWLFLAWFWILLLLTLMECRVNIFFWSPWIVHGLWLDFTFTAEIFLYFCQLSCDPSC